MEQFTTVTDLNAYIAAKLAEHSVGQMAEVIPLRPRQALGRVATIPSLPDNVFLLPKTPPLEPEVA